MQADYKGISFIEVLIILAIVLLLLGIIMGPRKKEPTLPPPASERFHLILKEHHDYYTFNVWQDSATGQEITCVTGYREPTCWVSGKTNGAIPTSPQPR